jgi:hypothetical protein
VRRLRGNRPESFRRGAANDGVKQAMFDVLLSKRIVAACTHKMGRQIVAHWAAEITAYGESVCVD